MSEYSGQLPPEEQGRKRLGPRPDSSRKALDRAKRVRLGRAALKKELKAHRVNPWELIAGNNTRWEPIVREWRIDRFLEHVPGVGPVSIHEALVELGLAPYLTMQGLTFERRRELADLLRAGVAGEPAPPRPTPIPGEVSDG